MNETYAGNIIRVFRYVGDRSAGAGRNGARDDLTVAQGWGPEHVAIALAVARLADLGHCATIDAIAKLAGMSTSTCGKYLRRQRECGPASLVDPYDARDAQCGDAAHRRSAHYQPGV